MVLHSCLRLGVGLTDLFIFQRKKSPEPTLMTYYPSPVNRDDKPPKTLDVQTINVQFYDDEVR